MRGLTGFGNRIGWGKGLTIFMGLVACACALAVTPAVERAHAQVVVAQCEDGIDNDGDTLIDFPADPGCSSASDDDETDPPAAPPAPSGLGSVPTSPANNNNPAITGTAEANSTVTIYTNISCSSAVAGSGTASGGGSFSISVSVADDSTTTFYATATNQGGTSGCSFSSTTYREDSSAPQTTIDSGPSGLTTDSTPTFTFSSSEGSSSFQCRVDAASFAACSSPFTTAALADGSHTFDVRATDGAGNTDSTPASRSFTVDAAAPQTTILSGPSGLTNNRTPMFTFSSSESGSTFQCRVDAAAFAACSSPFTTAALADGAHTFEVKATDGAGNTDATPASRSFTVDTTAPPAPSGLASSPVSPANNNNPAITGSAQAGSTVRLYTNASCSSSVAGSATAGGAGTFSITVSVANNTTTTYNATATDPAGNPSGCSVAKVTYIEDSAPPDTTIDTGPLGLTNDSTPTFTFSSSEVPSTFQCRVDAGAFAACASPYTTAVLADGAHTFQVRAIDAAGNIDATAASRSITVDSTALNAPSNLTISPASPANNNNPVITGSAEPNSTVRIYTNVSCSSAVAATVIVSGAGTFSVPVTVPDNSFTTFYATATDQAGNRSGCSIAPLNYVEDSTAPQTTIDSGPSGSTNISAPTFTFSSSEGSSTFECRVDAASFSACGSPFTTAALADGSHTFEVRATDAAGNVDATPAARSFAIDTSAPAPQGGVLDVTTANQAAVPGLLTPFPIVRVRGRYSTRGVRLEILAVRAPIGSRLRIHCSGGGCPRRSSLTTIRHSPLRVHRFERHLLRPGAVLDIYVWKPGTIGKYLRLHVRRGRAPSRIDSCVSTDGRRAMKCPRA
jgi:hypothetical protein